MADRAVTVAASQLSLAVVRQSSFIGTLHAPWSRSHIEPLPDDSRTIFTNVTATFPPGQLSAIMGGSGSGKTSLLEVVLGRVGTPADSQLRLSGSVRYNGQPLTPQMKRRIGYVPQHDRLLPYLTVRETLTFAVKLRLANARRLGRAGVAQLVERTMRELGLSRVADTIIGDELQRGISGGEKRRVSVGVQLVTDPDVLFLDEPTTGLDAFTAFNLIKTLTAIARPGKTVVISIHQPRADIFHLLDRVTLLSYGRLVYTGPTADIYSYFSALGHVCPVNVNIANFIIDESSIDLRSADAEAESRLRVDALVSAWSSAHHDDQVATANLPAQDSSKSSAPFSWRRALDAVTANLRSTKTLAARNAINIMRDKLSTWGNLAESCLIAVIIGYLFFQVPDTAAGLRSRAGAVYATIGLQPYLLLILNVYRLCEEFKIFDRERRDGMYSVLAYLNGNFMANVAPMSLVYACYSTIVYLMFGFRLDNFGLYYFRFVLVNLLHYWSGVALAWLCVAINRNFTVASLIANTGISFLTFTCGFFINIASLPPYVAWIRYCSTFWYSYRAILSGELTGRVFSCPLPTLTDPGCLAYDGNFFLSTQGSRPDDFVEPVWRMLLIWLVTGALTYLVMLLWQPTTGATYSSRTFTAPPIESGEKQKEAEQLEINTKGVNENSSKKEFNVVVSGLSVTLSSKTSLLPFGPRLERCLLDNVTTTFEAGKVSVILGGSGAGKSTLLNSIAGRLSQSFDGACSLEGKLMAVADGVTNPIDSSFRRQHMAYVTQGDNRLLPSLTLRETLHYAARLRLPHHMTMQQQIGRAEQIILLLGLKECANKLVGDDAIRGISGGEKRRLSVGVQLLQNPGILLLDEPTSGLDAFSAHGVMLMLQQLAEGKLFGKRCTVICTIHQPRSDIYQLFDSALLLVNGGCTVYSGPRENMVPYLEQFGVKCPAMTNPADFALDVSMVDSRGVDEEKQSQDRVKRLIDAYQPAKDGVESQPVVAASADKTVTDYQSASFTRILPVLLARSYKNIFRQTPLVISRISQVVAYAGVLTLHFARLDNSYESVQTRYGVIQEHLALVFIGLLNNLAVYPQERNNFYMEHEEGVVTVGAFNWTYWLNEVPFEAVSAMIFVMVTDWLGGLQMSGSIFIINSLICFSLVNVGESIGIVFCTFFTHVGIAVSFTNVALSLMGMMSGIFSLDMPALFNALNYVVPTWYAAHLMVRQEFLSAPIQFTCTESQRIIGSDGAPVCPIQTGQDAVDAYKFNDGYSWDINLIAILALTAGYRLGAYAIIARKLGRRRK